jgi:hypothetical protein
MAVVKASINGYWPIKNTGKPLVRLFKKTSNYMYAKTPNTSLFLNAFCQKDIIQTRSLTVKDNN